MNRRGGEGGHPKSIEETARFWMVLDGSGHNAEYRRYFYLVAVGRKTIEIRVQRPELRKLKAGDHIRFICGQDDVLTQVKRVARYSRGVR